MVDNIFSELDIEKEKPIQDDYRLVFSGLTGRRVLGDILFRCGVGNPINWENPAEVGQHNVGMFVLAQMGINIISDSFLAALVQVPLIKQEDKR